MFSNYKKKIFKSIKLLTNVRTLSTNVRKFNFKNFYSEYKDYFEDQGNNIELPSYDFLTLLIEFTESDGSFIVVKWEDIYFVIIQDTRDIQVLYMIQNVLDFWKVIKQGKIISRYIIQD